MEMILKTIGNLLTRIHNKLIERKVNKFLNKNSGMPFKIKVSVDASVDYYGHYRKIYQRAIDAYNNQGNKYVIYLAMQKFETLNHHEYFNQYEDKGDAYIELQLFADLYASMYNIYNDAEITMEDAIEKLSLKELINCFFEISMRQSYSD